MRIKIYTEHEVKKQWDEVWRIDNIERNMAKLDYPEYWEIFDKYISKEDKLIEAGCGLGKWINYFSTRGYNITGIDYSTVAIEALKEYNSSFKVELGDITAIPFENESFNVYLSFGVLEHLQREEVLQKAIDEIYRILTLNGVAIITIPYLNIANFKFALWNHIWSWKTENKNFFEYNYTIKSFLSHFDLKNKFEIEAIVPENIPLILKRKRKYRKNNPTHQFNTNLNEKGLKRWDELLSYPDSSFIRRQNSHLMIYVLRKKG